MRRQTQHLLLFLLGGMLIRITADDTYLRYVRPGHRWLLVAAGIVAAVLALVALWRDARPTIKHEHGDGHQHGAGDRHAPGLLLVPVLVMLLISPPALGADAVARTVPAATAAPAVAFPPLPPGELTLSVAEFVQRAAWDSGGSLDGREVTLTGFLLPRPDGVQLARLTIFCCAADVRANRIRLAGADGVLTGFPADTWLRVRGTLQPGSATADTKYVPTLTLHDAQPVPAPPDPYEY